MHDALNRFAGVGDQGLRRRAGDREEPDQVLWRREHGDVLDAFVVGLAGAVDAMGIPSVWGGGFGVHRGLLN